MTQASNNRSSPAFVSVLGRILAAGAAPSAGLGQSPRPAAGITVCLEASPQPASEAFVPETPKQGKGCRGAHRADLQSCGTSSAFPCRTKHGSGLGA